VKPTTVEASAEAPPAPVRPSRRPKKRMAAKLQAIKAELIRRRHEPKAAVGEWLQKVVLGYYRYHAVPGNENYAFASIRQLSAEIRSGRISPVDLGKCTFSGSNEH
jgi:hypothetical protein